MRCAINQRHKLEHLCRYITRPAIANERLKRNRDGQVVLQLKSPYHDGTTHIVMEPLKFMQRFAALVPRPRLRLIRFHGVLAPNAKLRPAGAKGARLRYFHNGSSPCSAMAYPVTLASSRGRPRGLASRRCPVMRSILA